MQTLRRQQALTPQQALSRAAELFDAGNLTQAEELCRRIIEAQRGYHPAYYQLGLIAVKVGKLTVAAEMIEKALHFDPANAVYHRAIGEIFRRSGKLEKAIFHGREATKHAPDDADGFYNLGIALADGSKFQESATSYRRALTLNPAHGLAANNLGSVMERIGDEDAALTSYRRAVEINPSHAEAQNNLGAILSARGNLEEARACFSAAIESDPAFVHAHYNLSTLKKYCKGDPHLAVLEAMLNIEPSLPVDVQMRFWFSIGKAWEDTGRYDEAFDAYQRGNSLKRKSFKYDIAETEAYVSDIMCRFDSAFFQKKVCACNDETPVFIVGMPRSGSTLIEQILSSHSKVFGAGELRCLSEEVNSIAVVPTGKSYMDGLLKAEDDVFLKIGEAYMKRVRALNGTALRICDKMPGNLFFVGLIHKALPKAKIIYTTRDLMDVCISNYSRLFNETMPFAYDLAELGRYCRLCNQVMEHWRNILPVGTVLEVKYEDVVDDLESQVRRLISHCGLSWEDSCLAFHENNRHVKTASSAQVRQPIYGSSVGRWRRFEKFMEPAIEGFRGT